jgi:hypothetical protein
MAESVIQAERCSAREHQGSWRRPQSGVEVPIRRRSTEVPPLTSAAGVVHGNSGDHVAEDFAGWKMKGDED